MLTPKKQLHNYKKEDRHEERWQQIQRLAVFQLKERQTGRRDEQTADDEQFGHECVADCRRRNCRDEVEQPLPTKQYGCGKHHAEAVGRSENRRRNEVERRIREQERVVALQRAHHRTEHRQRTDAIKQNRRGKAVGKGTFPAFRRFVLLKTGDKLLKPTINIEPRANHTAERHRHDKQHGILTLREILNRRVQPNCQTDQAQSVVKHGLVFLLDASVEHRAEDGSRNNRAGIDNRSNHVAKV